MRRGSCIRVARWLPLYVGGDLAAPGKAARVSEHLRHCRECARQAEELGAWREDFKLHAPPSFDEAFYDSLRRAVLRDIDAPAPRTIAPPWAGNFFAARRFAASLTALAACVVLVTAAAVVWSTKNRSSGEDEITRRATSHQQSTAPETAPNNAPSAETTTGAVKINVANAPRGGAASPKKLVVRRRRAATTAEVAAAAPARIDSVTSSATGTAPLIIKPAAGAKEVAGTPAPPAPELTRIEIQTADPNVRIIWLTPAARP